MSWEIGTDTERNRFIGYGVVAYCDHPECNETIDRGLGHVCGGEPYGGEHGCGLFFCSKHKSYYSEEKHQCCSKCGNDELDEYKPSQEHPGWINHLKTDPSWEQWRLENPNYFETSH